MIKQAVILAGGKGTRLGALTRHTPKPMLSVGGRPFLCWVLGQLESLGFEECIILCGPFEETFQQTLGDSQGSLSLVYRAEPKPMGTAGASVYALDRLQDQFLLVNGDTWLGCKDIPLTLGDATSVRMYLRAMDDVSRYGSVLHTQGKATGFQEKGASGPGAINAGWYVLSRAIVENLGVEPLSLEKEVLPDLVQQGKVEVVTGAWDFIDIGVPDDFDRAQALLPQWGKDV